jgi:prepilin-type N-terminal cleavage/methylation domain-containing protein
MDRSLCRRDRRAETGFTLIELMIVVVIVGILALVAVPRFTGVSTQAKQAEADPILKQLCQLAEADRLRTGGWPTGNPTGWTNPNARYFTFSFSGSSASAAPLAAHTDLSNRVMNCETGDISSPAAPTGG